MNPPWEEVLMRIKEKLRQDRVIVPICDNEEEKEEYEKDIQYKSEEAISNLIDNLAQLAIDLNRQTSYPKGGLNFHIKEVAKEAIYESKQCVDIDPKSEDGY